METISNNKLLIYKHFNDDYEYDLHKVYYFPNSDKIINTNFIIDDNKKNDKECITIIDYNEINNLYDICYQKINYIWYPHDIFNYTTNTAELIYLAHKFGPSKCKYMSLYLSINSDPLIIHLSEVISDIKNYQYIFDKEDENIIYKKHNLEPGLSFIIRAKNEEKNIRYCLNNLKKLLDINPTLEIIFVDNGSSDNTYQIALEYSKVISNMSVYQFKKKLLRCGKEHQKYFKTHVKQTFGYYTQWSFSKATRHNVIKWDCDWIPINENLNTMIQEFKLTDRNDSFALWFTGETVFIHKDKWYKNPYSYELYNEPRCFSKLNGFSYINSSDGLWETAWCEYFINLDKSKIYHNGRGTYYYYHVVLGANHEISKSVLEHHNDVINSNHDSYNNWKKIDTSSFQNSSTLQCIYSYNDINKPIFFEIKRSNGNEFNSRTNSMPIDERDQLDYIIIKNLSHDNIGFLISINSDNL